MLNPHYSTQIQTKGASSHSYLKENNTRNVLPLAQLEPFIIFVPPKHKAKTMSYWNMECVVRLVTRLAKMVSEPFLTVITSVRRFLKLVFQYAFVNSLSKILIKEFLLVKFPSILLATFGSRNFITKNF